MPRLTHRQGWHFDSKQSRFEIIPFMAMHKIGLDSLSKPISSFKNFNDFFSRSLSAETRPLHSEGKETVAVAPADCRMTMYKSIRDCDKILVKGTGINLQNLLCNVDMAADFSDGSVAVCRLAPCDTHSWNAPVKGVQGRIFSIEGEMNAVHPVARNHDALHRNKRVVTEIVSNDFGKVGFVAVGGPLVNSVQVEAKPLQEIARGQRHGCFKFGGSTVVLLFAKQRIGFDSDLLKNSLEPIETFVKANDRIGIAMQPQRESAKKKN
ncbi:phosphatidylserine decarboxylase [Bonamia ostreae]|uniref:Phosphatidylserine decarboxylase n=1 Tax=Bonamia ostreae TaxID=126728 RepID=A0ABV2AM35_9EUKA